MDTVRLGYDTSILLPYLTLKIISTHSIVTFIGTVVSPYSKRPM